eukprot:TRINITY_DN5961_c0_g1_i1.p1 TRINITY_DN5961_c0_g1~~TRINITY_DN5961_c0_g1_i1.p1  ORF type:complete len:2241 (+),score=680.72 TRINITY_DN5961_c0_g1_i1:94-6723(+)
MAGLSSLAGQLNVLAGRQTQERVATPKNALAYRLPSKASILFDPKKASTFDTETVYNIGVNGLLELIKMDDRFIPFESSLFSQSTTELERDLMTKEENKKLDRMLSSILSLMSQYFLLQPCHKVMEYLSRQYRVNIFNVDSVFRCILPFHNTPVFVRMVQQMRLRTTRWAFLEPIQGSGAPLERSVLVERSRHDFDLLQFISKMVRQAVSKGAASKTLMSFYAAFMLELLGKQAPSDELLAQIMPHLLKGLRSTDRAYQIATYMIVAKLSCVSTLSSEVNATLVHRLLKHSTNATREGSLEALICLLQFQENATLTQHDLAVLCGGPTGRLSSKLKEFAERMTDMSRFFHVALSCLLSTLRSETDEESIALLTATLKSVLLHVPSSDVSFLSRSLIKEYLDTKEQTSNDDDDKMSDNDDNDITSAAGEHYQIVLKALHRKDAQQLDASVNYLLKKCKKKASRKEALLALLVSSLRGLSSHQPLEEANSTLWLALQHNDARIRLMALNKFEEIETEKQEEGGDDDDEGIAEVEESVDSAFRHDILLARLADDNVDVVSRVLQIERLVELVDDAAMLFNALDVLLHKYQQHAAMQRKVLRVLKHPAFQEESSVRGRLVRVALSFLLSQPSAHRRSKLAYKLLKGIDHALFAGAFTTADYDFTDLATANVVVSDLAANVVAAPEETVALLSSSGSSTPLALAVLAQALDGDYAPTTGKAKKGKAAKSDKSALLTAVTGPLLTLVTSARLGTDSLVQLCTVPQSDLNAAIERVGDKSGVDVAFAVRFALHSLCASLPSGSSTSKSGVLEAIFTFLHRTRQHIAAFRPTLKALLRRVESPLSFLSSVWLSELNNGNSVVSDDSVVRTPQPVISALNLAVMYASTLALSWSTGAQKPDSALIDAILARTFLVLSSPSPVIRAEALKLVSTLTLCFEAVKKPSSSSSGVVALPKQTRTALLSAVAATRQEISVSREPFIKLLSSSTSTLSEQHRAAAVQWLVSHVVEMQRSGVTELILRSLHRSHPRQVLESSITLARTLLDQGTDLGPVDRRTLSHIISCVTPSTVSLLNEESEHLEFVLDCFSSRTAENNFSPASIAFAALKPYVYTELTETVRVRMLTAMFSTLSSTEGSSVVAEACRHALQLLPLDAPLLSQFMLLPPSAASGSTSASTKKKKTQKSAITASSLQVGSGSDAESLLASDAVFEVVRSNAPLLRRPTEIVTSLFEYLKALLLLLSRPDDSIVDSIESSIQLVLAAVAAVSERLYGSLSDGDDGSAPSSSDGNKRRKRKAAPRTQEQKDLLKEWESLYSIETVVTCIRESDDPQTHNKALVVLSVVSRLFPWGMVEQVVPIFTLMSERSMRRDDNYTFHVIHKTIESVVPSLVEHGVGVRDLIQVFVTALPNIPAHRRVLLFVSLTNTLSSRFLYPVLLLLFLKQSEEEIPAASSSTKDKGSVVDMSEFIEILSCQFSVLGSMDACVRLLEVLILMDADGGDFKKAAAAATGGNPTDGQTTLQQRRNAQYFAQHSLLKQFLTDGIPPQQRWRLRQCVVGFVARFLRNRDTLSKLAGLTRKDERRAQTLYSSLFRLVLEHMQQVDLMLPAGDVKDEAVLSVSEHVKESSYAAIDEINELLTVDRFLESVASLIQHTDPEIRRRALLIFNDKVTTTRDFLQAEHFDLVVTMMQRLTSLVQDGTSSQSDELVVNTQMSLYSLEILARNFAAQNPDPFVQSMAIVIGAIHHPKTEVCSSALICLATYCSALETRALPFLPKVYPLIVQLLARSSQLGEGVSSSADLLRSCALSSLQVILSSLPKFASPFLPSVLVAIFHPTLLRRCEAKVDAILEAMAEEIEPRLLLPILVNYIGEAILGKTESLIRAVTYLHYVIDTVSRQAVRVQHTSFFKLFLRLFDYRALHCDNVKLTASIDIVEDQVVLAFTALVMKISENMFRPIFTKTLDWAGLTAAGADDDDNDDNDADNLTTISRSFHRRTFVYRLMNGLNDTLKSIFLSYNSYVLDDCVSSLNSYSAVVPQLAKSSGAKSKAVKKKTKASKQSASEVETATTIHNEHTHFLLQTLTKCFLYDNEGFVDTDKFEKLMLPIVNSMEAGALIGATDIVADAVKCLAQLAVTVNTDVLWKPLNYQVLLKTRHTNPAVRLAALEVVNEFYVRLGEEFILLLPETVPFLVELMEDSDEVVERRCQEVIQTVNNYLGDERIENYF